MIISEKERFDKYVKEQCRNCKNRDKDFCEIRTSELNGIITTKCEFYEKEIQLCNCMKRRCDECKLKDRCLKNEGGTSNGKTIRRKSVTRF